MPLYLLVQPWGCGARRFIDATVVSEHRTLAEAYAALDAMVERMAAHGGRSDAVELFVVDETRRPVQRPDRH